MKIQNAVIIEHLFKLARKRGKRTSSYDSDRSDGPATGYGWKKDCQYYILISGKFNIKATNETYISWTPTADSTTVTQYLEIIYGKKIIFRAKLDGPQSVSRFTIGDEQFLGTENTVAEHWKRLRGKIPAKYLMLKKLNGQRNRRN